jgi:hypothetical protein
MLNALLEDLDPDVLQQVTTGWPAPPLDAAEDTDGTTEAEPAAPPAPPKRTTKRTRTRKRRGSASRSEEGN